VTVRITGEKVSVLGVIVLSFVYFIFQGYKNIGTYLVGLIKTTNHFSW